MIEQWFSEGGIIENATVVAYLACLALMLFGGGLSFLRRYSYLPVLVLLMALRELDFDKRFTAVGILKSRFFFSDQVSLSAKFVGLGLIFLLAWAVFSLLRHHVFPYIGARFHPVLKARPRLFGLTATCFGLIIGSKSVDGLASKLPGLSPAQIADIGLVLMLIEETAELAIPFTIAAVFVLWWLPDHRAAGSKTAGQGAPDSRRGAYSVQPSPDIRP